MSMKESNYMQRRLGLKKAWEALESVPAYKENNFYYKMIEHHMFTNDEAVKILQKKDIVDGSL